MHFAINSRRLARRARKLVRSTYYRFIFGRKRGLDRSLGPWVLRWEDELGRRDTPQDADRWDAQYASGSWRFLEGLGNLPHNMVISGYVVHFQTGGSVLDVGCGEGVLARHLKPFGYSTYLGIDISRVALERASSLKDERTRFLHAEAETYEPTESYDVIIFNESLYYLKEPLETFRRYTKALSEDGVAIVSLYTNSKRASSILSLLKETYLLLHETDVLVPPSGSNTCVVFRPTPRR